MTDATVPLGDLAGVPDRITLMASADPAILELVHAALAQLWTAHEGVDDVLRIRFETSVVEILGNIIEHAYEADAAVGTAARSRRFQLVLGVTDRAVLAIFADNGEPAALDLSSVTMPEADAESGRGLALAQAALDVLAYERTDDGRNVWRLEVHRTAA